MVGACSSCVEQEEAKVDFDAAEKMLRREISESKQPADANQLSTIYFNRGNVYLNW